ncbi:MAG: amidohydrolase [Candidatus Thermochlorobacter aerophilum]|uniref:Amidohydrolase n=1 Tax=Candidatus Thermochlorobacter aerophilus TaxID=1868324 RepID=A0A395M1I4_9BACT|nr:MAG: amidohydrolase [Candidatus Thermochlorobacter aerophilum]
MNIQRLLFCTLFFSYLSFQSSLAQLAVKGDVIYTMAGAPIQNGVVLISGGKIERVGSATEISIPTHYKVITAKVVTPGLIDAHSVVGLSGIFNYNHDQDQLEKSDPIQPELRAVDAYNANERLVEFLRDFGITTLHTGHGTGALISGQTMIVKTHGSTVEQALVKPVSAVAFTLGATVQDNFQKPGTRSKGVAMLREKFIEAQDYARKMNSKDPSKRPTRDLKLEVLADILDRKIPALVTANKAPDIMTALRLQKEFGFKMILDGVAEAYLVLDELKAANVPVILHPTMVRTYGDTRNASFETAAKLKQAGIKFALQSGYESYVPKTRLVLYEAALAVANGLSLEDGLRTITIDAAEILGVSNRVGSLEKGKDADVVCFDGDPFEYTSHVCQVIINGILVKEHCN